MLFPLIPPSEIVPNHRRKTVQRLQASTSLFSLTPWIIRRGSMIPGLMDASLSLLWDMPLGRGYVYGRFYRFLSASEDPIECS